MPKQPTNNSTARRHKLAESIDLLGDIRIIPCSHCNKNNRLCMVHTRSGKCGQCLRRNIKCDNLPPATQSEFQRVVAERDNLRRLNSEMLEVLKAASANLSERSAETDKLQAGFETVLAGLRGLSATHDKNTVALRAAYGDELYEQLLEEGREIKRREQDVVENDEREIEGVCEEDEVVANLPE